MKSLPGLSGAGKQNVRTEAITRTKLLRNHSQALLRGVITIGDCYTKGTEVRVTVGMKPETVKAAEGLAGAKQPLTGVDEVNNAKNLKKF